MFWGGLLVLFGGLFFDEFGFFFNHFFYCSAFLEALALASSAFLAALALASSVFTNARFCWQTWLYFSNAATSSSPELSNIALTSASVTVEGSAAAAAEASAVAAEREAAAADAETTTGLTCDSRRKFVLATIAL